MSLSQSFASFLRWSEPSYCGSPSLPGHLWRWAHGDLVVLRKEHDNFSNITTSHAEGRTSKSNLVTLANAQLQLAALKENKCKSRAAHMSKEHLHVAKWELYHSAPCNNRAFSSWKQHWHLKQWHIHVTSCIDVKPLGLLWQKPEDHFCPECQEPAWVAFQYFQCLL